MRRIVSDRRDRRGAADMLGPAHRLHRRLRREFRRQQRLAHRLHVDRREQRLAHALVLEDMDAGAVGAVEEDVVEGDRRRDDDLVIRILRDDCFRLVVIDMEDEVEIADHDLRQPRLRIGDGRHLDAADLAGGLVAAPIVIGVLDEDDVAGGGIEALDLVGPGADGMEAEGRRIGELRAHMLGHDLRPAPKPRQHDGASALSNDAHRIGIDLLDMIDPAEARILEEEIVLRVGRVLEGIDHVVGGHLDAVAEFDAVAELASPASCCRSASSSRRAGRDRSWLRRRRRRACPAPPDR